MSYSCINCSLWATSGQRLNKTQVVEFSDPQAFLRFLDTDTPDVRHVSIINDHLVEVHYQHQEKDIPVYPNVNIFVACFNTSCARHLTKGLLSAIFFHTPTKVNVNRLKARREAPWRIKGFIPRHVTFFLYIPEHLDPSHFILHSKQPRKQESKNVKQHLRISVSFFYPRFFMDFKERSDMPLGSSPQKFPQHQLKLGVKPWGTSRVLYWVDR